MIKTLDSQISDWRRLSEVDGRAKELRGIIEGRFDSAIDFTVHKVRIIGRKVEITRGDEEAGYCITQGDGDPKSMLASLRDAYRPLAITDTFVSHSDKLVDIKWSKLNAHYSGRVLLT